VTTDRVRATGLWLALVAADALFLWMFLSVVQLEAIGQAARGASETWTARPVLQFVADWRHGMAGNSPLYMPGFFALAAAAWYWTRAQSLSRLLIHGVCALGAGACIAWLASPIGEAAATAAFERTFGVNAARLSSPVWQAGLVGAYTAACWTVFVVASKKALVQRTFRPFAVVPIPYVALVFTRTWSVNGLLATWCVRAADGDPIAVGSFVAIPVLTAIFVKTTRRKPGHDASHGLPVLR